MHGGHQASHRSFKEVMRNQRGLRDSWYKAEHVSKELLFVSMALRVSAYLPQLSCCLQPVHILKG